MGRLVSDKYLNKRVDDLKRSALKHRNNNKPGQRRYWMYPYLQDVYALFREFQSRGISRKAGRRIIRLLHLSLRKKSHVLRILIEASAGPEDNRTKIKWASALRYAYGWLQPPERLEWFFGVNEGIAGCAAKFAFLRAARRQEKGKIEANLSDQSSAQSVPVSQLPSQN